MPFSVKEALFLSQIIYIMKDKLLSRFCLIAILEGLSYIFLLGVSMPIKYGLGNELWVKYNGWIHGLLFVIYVVLLIRLAMRDNWKMSRISLAFFATFVPFLPFYVERKLRKEYQENKGVEPVGA